MKLLRVLSLPWRALAAHRSSRRTVIGGFVPVAPHPRCIVDMPRYVANWTAKYGRKLRARVLQQTTSAPRITNIPPLSPSRQHFRRHLRQLAVALLDLAGLGGELVAALRAAPSLRRQRAEAVPADAHPGARLAPDLAVVGRERPLPRLVRQPVAIAVTDMIEQQRVGLALAWSQEPADLLQVQAERLRRPQEDADVCAGNIYPFIRELARCDDFDAPRSKVIDYPAPHGSLH